MRSISTLLVSALFGGLLAVSPLAQAAPAQAAPARTSIATTSITGTITGTGINGAAAAPLPGAYASVYDETGEWYDNDTADENGTFEVRNLPAGTYTIEFSANDESFAGEWWNDQPDQNNATYFDLADSAQLTGFDAELTRTALITGTVTADDTDQPLADVWVTAEDSDGRGRSVSTDEAGNYAVKGLTPGDYSLRFAPGTSDYTTEWWNDQPTQSTAETITLTTGQELAKTDAGLSRGASISGRVTGNDDAAVPNAYVTAYTSTLDWVTGVTSDENGEYSLGQLPAGEYLLQFEDWEGDFSTEWWDNQPTNETATAITLSAGAAVTDISPQLRSGSSISGRVTSDARDGEAVADVYVQAYTQVTDGDYTYFDYAGSASTTENGSFTVKQLEPGTYTLRFRPNSGNDLAEWWNNQPSQTSADTFAVAADEAVTGKDAGLSAGATITGTVVSDGDTAPLANIEVTAVNAEGSYEESTSTDESGNYTIGNVKPGDYTLRFQDRNDVHASEWWNDHALAASADYFAVATGEAVIGKDAGLARAATISGTVTVAGAPLPDGTDAQVDVYDASGESVGSTSTDENGAYRLGNLAAGDYSLEFSAWGADAFSEWWQNQPDQESADSLTVAAGDTLTDINADLEKAATISGTITGDGAPGATLADVRVRVYNTDGDQINSARTDENGDYTVTDLREGTYTLQFSASTGASFLSEWWDGQPTQEQATPITLKPSESRTNVDATLAAGATVSGRVTTDDTGTPIPDASVYLYNAADEHNGNVDYAYTDADGNYSFTGLAAGTYTLQFSPGSANFLREWWNDQPSRDSATTFTVAAAESVGGKDAALTPGASISGTVTSDATPTAGLAEVRVSADGGSSYESVNTDADGRFTLTGLPAGSYTLQFEAYNSNHITEYYNNQPSSNEAEQIVLEPGQAVTGITAALAPGAAITGTVTADAGAGLPEIQVTARNTSGSIYEYGSTDASGNYTVDGLPAGSYTLEFRDYGSTSYTSEWWNNQPAQESAEYFTVLAGEIVGGKNAGLALGATITGTLSVDGGEPLTEGQVTAYPVDGGDTHSASVDSNGAYSLTSLAPGDYDLRFSSWQGNALAEWWNDKNDRDDADSITVSSGQLVSNINAELADGATISGRVTGAGSPAPSLRDVQVYAYDADGSNVSNTSTDRDGNYTLSGLTAGSYSLQFQATKSNYLAEWWNDKPSQETATTITVGAGETVTGKNAVLAASASISGNVKGAGVTNTNLRNVMVMAISSDSDQSTQTASADTDASGNYTIRGLRAGSYTLQFMPYSNQDFAPEYWNGKLDLADATYFTVADEQAVTGKDVVLTAGASLSGSVLGALPTGVSNDDVYVQAYRPDGVWGGYTEVDSAGQYAIRGLRADTYTLRFGAYSDNDLVEWWNDQPTQETATPITLKSGEKLTGLDVDFSARALTATPTPTITGTNQVGKTLTATPGTWTPAPVTLTYQWIRAGTAIPGATSGTYLLTDADANTAITVDVTGTKTGYTPVNKTSAAVTVERIFTTTPAPTIAGTTTVGQKLTASTGTWAPVPGTVSYQWLRDGTAINGATASSYTLAAADAGKALSVTVTAAKSGYTTASQTSGATAAITGLLTSTPVPTITGAVEVGQTLTSTSGTWAPAPVALSYQWLRGSTPIDGATAATYKPVTADAGSTLSVTVTGTKAGYITVPKSSAATAVVTGGILTATPVPTIAGTTTVGQTLTATAGTWAPAPVTLGYQWLRAGTAISGATTSSYTLTTADAGQTLTVRVTGTKAGFTTVSSTSTATAAIAQLLTATPTPTITGTAKLGQTLTAKPGTWTPATVTLKYQWARNGTAISGATTAIYKPVTADAGATLTVTVTGTKSGYITATKTSAATAMVTGGVLTTAPAPTLTGTTTVGQTLTAKAGTWAPATVTLSYQWLRSGAVISGATASSYKLVAADAGKAITVKVTGTKPGFTTVAKTSAATVAISKPLTATPTPTIAGTVKVGQTLTAKPGTWAPATVTLKYQWLRAGKAISGATASTYKLVAADAGTTLTVTVTGSKSGYVTAATTSKATAMITGGILTAAPVPTVSGTTKVGQTLTAKAGTWAPATVTVTYQWLRSGAAISGATASAYKLTAADAGKTLSVKVTGTKTGFTTVAKTSTATAAVTGVLTATPTPTVTGKVKVGQTLTAKPGTWAPATVTLKYQWFRSGTAISKATAATYKPVAADVGKTLTVKVTGSKAGYTTVVKSSAATVKVVK
ncbi:carboxypeptidase regulatory-like domain-containing protein [Cryobacterium sp. 1639]|uniref:carboxypeptidase regulatory-like domain-containing protein n=1 Tax=Cryobacterium inferilacus TaxID=2866629 RepID=UPI0027E2243B|nr:carboxypeptidase regulatory-like domain-containing protein [Cryobacterium sp. 1639]